MQKKNISSKIGLGTVQFGLDYGISNTIGKTAITEIKKILKTALKFKIDLLDTAFAYGNSQEVIGLIEESSKFKIVTKYLENNTSLSTQFNNSLKILNNKNIYGYLIHHFSYYIKNKNALDELIQLKKNKKVKKIGFSLNEVTELEFILKNKIPIDLIQIPINIFNQDFIPLLKETAKKEIEIHARSMFSQGLIFFNQNNLPKFFWPIKDKIIYFNNIVNKMNCTKVQLASSFLFNNEYIDKIIIGVNNNEQLIANIKDFQKLNRFSFSKIDYTKFKIEDDLYKIPSNWKT